MSIGVISSSHDLKKCCSLRCHWYPDVLEFCKPQGWLAKKEPNLSCSAATFHESCPVRPMHFYFSSYYNVSPFPNVPTPSYSQWKWAETPADLDKLHSFDLTFLFRVQGCSLADLKHEGPIDSSAVCFRFYLLRLMAFMDISPWLLVDSKYAKSREIVIIVGNVALVSLTVLLDWICHVPNEVPERQLGAHHSSKL